MFIYMSNVVKGNINIQREIITPSIVCQAQFGASVMKPLSNRP